jgi:hypothetical protein
MGPIDYSINVQQPFQAAMQGFGGGLAIQRAMDERAAQAAQQRAAQAMQADLAAFSTKPNRTAADYASIVAKYPQLSEHFKRGFDIEAPDIKAARVSELSNVFAALHNGSPDVAVDILTKKGEAARNSGDAQTADSVDAMARLIKINPQAASTAIGLRLHAATGDEKFAEVLAKLGGEKRAQELQPGAVAQQGATLESTRATTAKTQADTVKTQADTQKIVAELPFVAAKARAEVQNTLSQIADRGARLALDRDKFMSEVQLKLMELNQKAAELPDAVRKDVSTEAANAVSSTQTAGQMLDLANRLETAGGGYGGFATASEFFKSALGNQDAMTAMRQEYTRLRNSAAIKSLPPGPATDKDIALALKGFPSDTADSKTIASFLRGQAKLQQLEAATSEAKSEWLTANRHLGKAARDLEVAGVKVPAGTTFVDFSRQVIERKAREQATLSTIQASPYAGFANTPAPVSGLDSQ